MHEIIYHDPHILIRTFPDVIFSVDRDQLDITLQCQQQISVEDDTRKSKEDGDAVSDLVTSESCQPSRTNASPPQFLGRSDTHPRRSSQLVQRDNQKQSCPSPSAHDKPKARPLSVARNVILSNDISTKEELEPLERILAFMALGPRNCISVYSGDNEWKGWPKTSKAGGESKVVQYLNNVVNRARCFFNNGAQVPEGDDDFVFSTRYANRAVKSHGAKRKPYIVLVRRRYANAEESDGWGYVRAVGGLKPNVTHNKKELVGELTERSSLCFGHQPARRFVLAFSLVGTKMALWKYDRSGTIVSQEFDIHENPTGFLRVILGLALGPDYHVGYDPSFTYEGDKQFVELNGKRYEVMETLKVGDAILGRGTVVQRVRDKEGREFIMKDQWVDRSRATKEFGILQKLEEMGVQKVPRLVDYQLVSFKIGDEVIVDSTENDRSAYGSTWLEEKDIDIRVHYRLLMTPYGDDLGSFRSLKELVSVFRDFVEVTGIRDIREKEILHQDISLGNLILVEDDESSCRRGYIIDFDCAAHIGEAATARVGTSPFMAIDILLEEDVKHEYYHDLESLFYVLVWICLTHESPGGKRRNFDFKKSPLYQWMGGGNEDPDMATTALSKGFHILTSQTFQGCILDKLPSYIKQSEAMTEFLEKLREIVFRKTPLSSGSYEGRVVTEKEKGMDERDMHDVFSEIFDVFDEAIRQLENGPTPPDSGKETTSASGENTAPELTAEIPDGIQMSPLDCVPCSDL